MATLGCMWLFVVWMLAIQIPDSECYIEHEISLLGNPTTQNSQYHNRGEPSSGVDGNTDTNYFGSYSCTHNANAESNPWWSVDLEWTETITQVMILNRGDCCPERLYGIQIYLSDSPFSEGPTTRSCGFHEGVVGESDWVTITCDEPTAGRYLTVQLPGDGRILTMCEVRAFARFTHVLSRFATASGNDLPTMKSQYQSDMILPSIDTALGSKYVSLDVSEKALYKSPIVDCSWDRIQRVRSSLYTSGAEVMFMNFDVSAAGDDRSSFYSIEKLYSTSYTDLSTSYFNTNCDGRSGAFFNIDGQGKRTGAEHTRRFYVNCYYSGCSGDMGWFVFFDTDHGNLCSWENDLGVNPVFKYSAGRTWSLSTSWITAEVFTFIADLDDTFPDAISNCNGVPDGSYQSALACNIYVECTSNSLTYRICQKGKSFDDSTDTCVATSTTCTDTTFAGDSCYPDGCSPDPCSGSGTCSSDEEGWVCACKPGYTGGECKTDTCTSGGLCNNGAECTRNSVDSYTCDCAAGYDGDHCDNNIDECAGQTCNDQGTCVDGVASYTCNCSTGFAGDDCETNIDDCGEVECNNGECVDKVNDYSCSCEAGFEGDHCEVEIDECQPEPCVNGECTDKVNGYTCDCVAGYEGTNCDGDIDECANQTCSGHGTCQDGINEYTCECDEGYHGDDCEQDIDDCIGVECNNGGCVDQLNGYRCECLLGYVGDFCDIDFDECDSDPCENGGSCTDSVNSYTCDCVAGYVGDNCETDFDECSSTPCGSNGQCQDGLNSFVCNCNAGYTDDVCTVYDGCHDNPCENGGTCVDDTAVGSLDYTCNCQAEFTGAQCQVERICSADPPCENGTCTDEGDAGTEYTCTCDTGYVGTDCDVMDPCHGTEHCKNGGQCVVNGNEGQFFCFCVGYYLAPYCEYVDPCYESPCDNGGTCARVGSDPSDVTAECSCNDGFSGQNCENGPCETLDDPCTNDCVNNWELADGYECVDNSQLGGVDAQEGVATESDGVSSGGLGAFSMYALIAAVACAVLIGLTIIIIAVRKKKQRDREDEKKEQQAREAWGQQKEEKQIQEDQLKVQKAVEAKAARQTKTNNLMKDAFIDF